MSRGSAVCNDICKTVAICYEEVWVPVCVDVSIWIFVLICSCYCPLSVVHSVGWVT